MAKTLSEELTLGQRLARARREAGLNQGQLAQAIGVSRQTISNYETGSTEDVRFDIVARWAAATDVSLDYFGRTLVRSVDAIGDTRRYSPTHDDSVIHAEFGAVDQRDPDPSGAACDPRPRCVLDLEAA